MLCQPRLPPSPGSPAREESDLAAGFVRPRSGSSHQAFLTLARCAATTAAAHRELLQRYGMPETFPMGLVRQLDAPVRFRFRNDPESRSG